MDPTPPRNSYFLELSAISRQLSAQAVTLTDCHAERSNEESEAILTAESKHPYLRKHSEVNHRNSATRVRVVSHFPAFPGPPTA
jgi:hypothetical protein